MGDSVSTDLRFSIVPEWVLDSNLSDKALRVYTVLARYADNETGQCFPSLNTLAKRARCSRSSVIRCLDELVKFHAIERHRRDGENGFQSTMYVVKRVVSPTTLPSVTHDTTLVSPTDHPSVTGDTLTITSELEPRELYIQRSFDDFWSAYPRKVAKGQARRAFNTAMKKTTFEQIMAGLELYKAQVADEGIDFIAHASTWLNGERWDDDYQSEVTKRRTGRRQPNYVDGVRLVAKYQSMEADQIEQG